MSIPALLALEEGSLFHGVSVGATGQVVGEVVFNTSITGYQEILTDPSYYQQIVVLAYPHIGNVGTNTADQESDQIYARALLMRDVSIRPSNWRMQQSLPAYLEQHNLVGMAGLDTRRLIRILRNKGTQRACLVTGPDRDPEEAIAMANASPSLLGQDLARLVSTKKRYIWGDDNPPESRSGSQWRVFVYDFGVKRNLLRCLANQGCHLTIVPAQTPAEEVLSAVPDGIFLSNGPGDPEPCGYAIEAIRQFMQARIPLFGVCLGHQLLALAAGAKTSKMKFGHHGANHPVQDLSTGQVFISSQNHGFVVDENTLPATMKITHRSLFDGSIQGIRHTVLPMFGFQGHPEASPGPHDLAHLFDEFITMMQAGRG